MGLIQNAYETFEAMEAQYAGKAVEGQEVLAPIAHLVTRANLEITLDAQGRFVSARAVDQKEPKIVIPATEASAGRTSSPTAHPLCDNLGYLCGDDPKKKMLYITQLRDWADSPWSHPKLRPILQYVEAGTLKQDLARANLAELDDKGKVKNEKDMVCWRVLDAESSEGSNSACWLDTSLMKAFISYYGHQREEASKGLCMITGREDVLAEQHAKGVIAFNGNAKLISANDRTGMTFRGRFADDSQALTIGYETSQKVHNALRWLAANQGVNIGGRTFLCWNPGGRKIPKPHMPLYRGRTMERLEPTDYRDKLRETLRGWKTDLPTGEKAVIAAFDAATTGRLAVTYYSELPASDFLDRLYQWDCVCCWWHKEGEEGHGIWCPDLKRIAECAFGSLRDGNFFQCDDRVLKQQMQRLLACRVDCAQMPMDVVKALVQKAGKLALYDGSLREDVLFMTCAVMRKYFFDRKREEWNLALEHNRADRSYQFGRLMAVMEAAERSTYDRTEKREPNAIRLQPMLVQKPLHTSRTIIEQLKKAYFPRLNPGIRVFYDRLIAEILDILSGLEGWEKDRPLEDSYLMGYYLQKKELYTRKQEIEEEKYHDAEEQG